MNLKTPKNSSPSLRYKLNTAVSKNPQNYNSAEFQSKRCSNITFEMSFKKSKINTIAILAKCRCRSSPHKLKFDNIAPK